MNNLKTNVNTPKRKVSVVNDLQKEFTNRETFLFSTFASQVAGAASIVILAAFAYVIYLFPGEAWLYTTYLIGFFVATVPALYYKSGIISPVYFFAVSVVAWHADFHFERITNELVVFSVIQLYFFIMGKIGKKLRGEK